MVDHACSVDAASLDQVDSLDVDYDAISQSLVLRLFWSKPPETSGWTAEFDRGNARHRIEVGVLANEKPTQPEEISVGGLLTVVGKDSEPSNLPFLGRIWHDDHGTLIC